MILTLKHFGLYLNSGLVIPDVLIVAKWLLMKIELSVELEVVLIEVFFLVLFFFESHERISCVFECVCVCGMQ